MQGELSRDRPIKYLLESLVTDYHSLTLEMDHIDLAKLALT